MANFKKRRHIGRRSCRMCRRPWKVCGSGPDGKFSIAELRKFGGRSRRIRRRDVDWAFRDEAD